MTKADDAITAAMRQLGTPYVFGAESPNKAFDCSGLTQWVYANTGITLPRTADEQMKATVPVASPLPGDLVFWGDPAYHVAIYVGNNKVISAPHDGASVQIENVWGTPSQFGRVKGAGTALAPALNVVTTGLKTVSDKASSAGDWLGGARYTVIEAAFVATGIALVGFGVVRAVAPKVKGSVGQLL